MDPFTKSDPFAPDGFFATEAAGLRWLSPPAGSHGVRVSEVFEVTSTGLTLERIAQVAPTAQAAERFGRALAHTHALGARSWGQAPPNAPKADNPWERLVGDQGAYLPGILFLGRNAFPLNPVSADTSWGAWFASTRLIPAARLARQQRGLDGELSLELDRLINRVARGEFDAPEPTLVCLEAARKGQRGAASRIHGDLWAGNVLWDNSATGAVVVDPKTQGGAAEEDLAMLALFSVPYLDRIIAAYNETSAISEGWRERVQLHQLYPLLAHVVLFGGGYIREMSRVLSRY